MTSPLKFAAFWRRGARMTPTGYTRTGAADLDADIARVERVSSTAELDADIARLERENAEMEAKLQLECRPSFRAELRTAAPAATAPPAPSAESLDVLDAMVHAGYSPTPHSSTSAAAEPSPVALVVAAATPRASDLRPAEEAEAAAAAEAAAEAEWMPCPDVAGAVVRVSKATAGTPTERGAEGGAAPALGEAADDGRDAKPAQIAVPEPFVVLEYSPHADLEAWQKAAPRSDLFSQSKQMISGVLFAIAVYALLAWMHKEDVAAPVPCAWSWEALRCSAGCKMLMPGTCRHA